MNQLMPDIFRQLLVFVKFACTPPCLLHSSSSGGGGGGGGDHDQQQQQQQQQLPKYPPSRNTNTTTTTTSGSNNNNNNNNAYGYVMGTASSHHPVSSTIGNLEVVGINYIPFGEKAMSICVQLYQNTATEEAVMKSFILHEIIQVFGIDFDWMNGKYIEILKRIE